MSQNSFTILGTAAGAPSATRANSGYLVSINDRLTLLDGGGGVYQSFRRAGFDPIALDRIVISHTHPDHVCELPLFIQAVYLTGRSDPLTVYVPEDFIDPLKRFLEACYLFESRFPFELLIAGYDYGVMFEKPFELEAIPNSHLEKLADIVAELKLPNKLQCCSLDITAGKTRVLYSADIGSLDDILPHWDNHEYVILESAHIDWEHFYTHAPTAKVGQFIMTHLLSDQQASEIAAESKKRGLPNLVIAYDGMTLELK